MKTTVGSGTSVGGSVGSEVGTGVSTGTAVSVGSGVLVGGGSGVSVGLLVLVGRGVLVGIGVAVGTGVLVGLGVAVMVASRVDVGFKMAVSVGFGVEVGGEVAVRPVVSPCDFGVGLIFAHQGVFVRVPVTVSEGFGVDVRLGVAVAVGCGVIEAGRIVADGTLVSVDLSTGRILANRKYRIGFSAPALPSEIHESYGIPLTTCTVPFMSIEAFWPVSRCRTPLTRHGPARQSTRTCMASLV